MPNDDLDLQVLWLDAVKQYGEDFTSYDLQKVFCENCDYSPGEYAIMRKNYEKGIYPPESGRFCNDFYIQGMGCPIRSEIWACLYPAQPAKAAETYGLGYDLVSGANIAGFTKVAEAMMAQGCV